MFVYTMKASSIKFFAVIAVSVAVLAALIGILPVMSAASDAAAVTTDYRNISSVDDIREFLSRAGYETEPEPIRVLEISIPEEFNSVFEKYNDIQRAQGLNLKRYCGKSAQVYVFKVTNYDYEGEVLATVMLRGDRIVGGDICSREGDGFVHGFMR